MATVDPMIPLPRRALLLAAVVLPALLLFGRPALPDQSRPAPAPLVSAVESVGLTVSDLDRSVAFYTTVLHFKKLSVTERDDEPFQRLHGVFAARARVARLALGDEAIELTEYVAPKGRPAPVDARSNDRWFQHIAIIVSDMDRAYERLRRHRVTHISPGPQRLPDWNKNAGGIHAFYFRDPDGHPLEILSFPPDKGAPKWRAHNGRLFLGIDHTAIGVGDTEQSLGLYRDRLGMKVAGESENYGPEQERLNSVFGARLRITALRAMAGPGIELLEYLAPRDGRPFPVDERANDLVHWETRLTVGNVDEAWRVLKGRPFISPGPVEMLEGKKLAMRDPDGHVLVLSSH